MGQFTFVFSNLCRSRSDKKFPCVNSGDKKDVRRRILSCAPGKVRRRDWYAHAQAFPKSNYLSGKLVVEAPIW